MLKFRCSDRDGQPVLGLGLKQANLDKLRAGQPMDIEVKDLGITGPRVLLFFDDGTTEDQFRAAGLIDAETKIVRDQS